MSHGRMCLLDASALLALLQDEPAGKDVEPLLGRSAIHTVNLAEVITKLIQHGFSDVVLMVMELGLIILDKFAERDAVACGELHARTRGFGLSLGDCVCLTIAEIGGLVAVTKDGSWVGAVQGSPVEIMTVPLPLE